MSAARRDGRDEDEGGDTWCGVEEEVETLAVEEETGCGGEALSSSFLDLRREVALVEADGTGDGERREDEVSEVRALTAARLDTVVETGSGSGYDGLGFGRSELAVAVEGRAVRRLLLLLEGGD